MSMSEKILLRAEVPSELGGQRLDQVAAQLFAEHSRSRLSAWIKDGRLTVDGDVIRPRDIVHGGAILELTAEQEAQGEWVAQDIPGYMSALSSVSSPPGARSTRPSAVTASSASVWR